MDRGGGREGVKGRRMRYMLTLRKLLFFAPLLLNAGGQARSCFSQ